ncbi:predicted protein [Nematostella vectensis]|uniref:Mitochondrial ATPase complex subunit ATP10 n=1 Tax=Nematostella vectensis TaxID=45351 RepID=A7RU97_NEMVE|nr:predicted protein [Nematostella vectensis]|eukprot:XP_001637039.1 predicted protein [Nematostella vectensis]
MQLTARRTFLSKTKEEKQAAKEKRKQERKELVGEITKGYFSDLKELKQSGGKRFFAKDKLITEKDALVFPEFQAKNLRNRVINLRTEFPGSTTLVLMWLRAYGQIMCSKYKENFTKEFADHPDVKYFEVNVVEGWFYRLLKPFIEKSLRSQIPVKNQGNYLCYFGNTEPLKKGLVENVIVGYAFLVDSHGRVRWKAHGTPTQEELQYMTDCTNMLIRDVQKRKT